VVEVVGVVVVPLVEVFVFDLPTPFLLVFVLVFSVVVLAGVLLVVVVALCANAKPAPSVRRKPFG
jgi:hypothetical protein